MTNLYVALPKNMYIFCKELPVWYIINYYAKDGGQGAVRHLYSFHHDPL